MHENDERYRFVKRWIDKAKKEDHPFDRFFAAYMCLLILLQIKFPRKDEKSAIKKLFAESIEAAEQSFKDHEKPLNELLTRTAPKKNPIIDLNDPNNEENRDAIDSLQEIYLKNKKGIFNKYEITKIGALICSIRNNLFHGEKVYESDDDKFITEKSADFLIDFCERVVSN